MPGGPYLLGVDVGTSVIKSTLFDLEGHEVTSAARETVLQHPHPAWVELDMDEVWQAVQATVSQAVAGAKAAAGRILAVGLTGQGDGTWLVDRRHRPIRGAITWLDGRAAEYVKRFHDSGLSSRVFDITGTVISTCNQAAQLCWLQDHEPETLKQSLAALRAKDWIFLKMTGLVSTDETDASHTYFDIGQRAYSQQLFELFGLEAWRHLVPPAKLSYENIGQIKPDLAVGLELPSGTPVVAGPFDVAASDLGAGAIMPGDACTILGTAGIHQLIVDRALTAPKNIGYTMCHAPARRWVRFLPTMTGTLNLQWFAREFYRQEAGKLAAEGGDLWTYLEALAQQVPAGCEGVMYHPYIDPAGERVPFVKPTARAQFTGLSANHSREVMLRAVYEGVTLSALDCYSYLPAKISELKLAGGGSRSALWAQMFADALGCPVHVVEGKEPGAKGAAMNAGVAIGIYPSFEDAARSMIRPARTYQPNPDQTLLYRELLKIYRGAYQAMFELWDQSFQFRQKFDPTRQNN